MKKRDRQIVEIYNNYDRHIAAPKTMKSPFIVSKPKENHRGSYAAEQTVDATVPFGNTTVECEIRQGIPFNYSITYKTDVIDSRVLARLDTGDGTHRNRAPGIPLELSQVPTPHIHKFRPDGYSVAYPIPGVDYSSESSTKFDYQQGFDYFCTDIGISGHDSNPPQFRYAPDGTLVFPLDQWDPNEDADFTTVAD